jgi:hypothetical protein
LYSGLTISALKRQTSMKTKKDTANPLFRALFVGMTMKAWLNYAIRKNDEWEAMRDITKGELIFSDSDDEDYEIEYSDDGYEQQDDRSYEEGSYEEGSDGERERLDEIKEDEEEEDEMVDSKEVPSPTDLQNRQLVYQGSKQMSATDPTGDVFKKVSANMNNNMFLDEPDKEQAKSSSKLPSNNILDEEERPSSIINYNINNNFIINNNYFIHPDNPEPIRQTNVILERNITVNTQNGAPNSLRQLQSQNSRSNISERALQNGNGNSNLNQSKDNKEKDD